MTHVRWSAGLGMTAALVAMIGLLAPPAVAAEGRILGSDAPTAIKDSYIVELKDSAALRSQSVQSLASALAAKHGGTVAGTYLHALQGFAATMTEPAARQLAADPAVLRVQQNLTASITATQFNPPSWGLDRIDQRLRPLFASYTYPNTAPNVRAYIIDTGIRVTHQEFGGRAIFGANTVGGPNTDCNGHGTHVAGTVGGAAAGVAKQVALTAVKVLDCNGSGSVASILAGVDWVTGNHVSGPAVANMSLGVNTPVPALENAVRASIADGIVYAIASGNSNADACGFSPARTGEAITVNATDSTDVRASFSNYGPCTDIFAPGVNITSAGIASDAAYMLDSGTSMASPHVAGAAALVLGANPALNPQQVADTLYTNSTAGIVGNPGPGTPNRMLFVHHPAPPAPAPGPDRLVRGQFLTANQVLRSPNGLYTLAMQADGNLVLYNQASQALWHTHTAGNPGAYAVFQTDGNFVVYRANGIPLWHTVTFGTAANLFVVQNDSNIVIYGQDNQVYWHRLQ
jgi:subtilisin family serine protease